jgi:hypothetical protein
LTHKQPRPCPFPGAPPAVPPLAAAQRERRVVGSAQPRSPGTLALRARLARRRASNVRMGDAIGDETLSKTRAFIRRERARRSTQ